MKKKIISLGMNCEVSFQIEKYVDKLDSSLFSWAYVEDDELFLQALQNIDEIFEGDISFNTSSEDMFWCEQFRIAFHGRTNKKELFNEDGHIINHQLYDENIAELKSRLAYLKVKFKERLKTDEEVFYLKKMQINYDIEKAKKIITDIYNYFETNSKEGNFKLVIIVEDSWGEKLKEMEKERLLIRSVAFFAPVENTQNGADDIAWGAIFHEILTGERITKEKIPESMLQLYKQLKVMRQKCECYEFEIEKLRNLLNEKDKWLNSLQEGKEWLEAQYCELIKLSEKDRKKINI